MTKPKLPLGLKYGGWFLAWVAFSQGCIYLQNKATLEIMEKVMDRGLRPPTALVTRVP